ncbi:MAG: hypothetical protein LBC64_09350 [Fibromonadaceae bacterium]|jgi:hypothetical protein|nr:hypothetical protein [Fibromonadaceae bacterium]
MAKIQKTSELAKLSIAALLIGNSIVAAQEVPATEPAPVAEPVVTAPAPTTVAVVEPAPVAKPVESLSTSVAGTKISLYGRLELNAAYEDGITKGLWSAWATSPQKSVTGTDSGKTVTPQGRTSMSVARTRLGINLEGPSKEDEPSLKGRFEADFAGASGYSNFNGSSGFRIRQSWGSVTFKDIGLTLLFGQTDDVVTPLDPPSINPSSLNGVGNIGNRRPQIRATEAIGPVEVAVAVTHDRLRANDNIAPSTPGVQGRVGLKMPASWAGEKANFAVGVGGLYAKDEAAADDGNDKRKYGPDFMKKAGSNMFGADLSLPVIDILTLTGEFFMGKNLSRYGDGSLGLNYTSSSNPHKVQRDGLKSTGWWGALAAKLPANLSAAAGLGMENLDGDVKLDVNNVNNKPLDESTIIPEAPKGNMFIFANLAYNFTSAAKVTFEYLNLSTDFADKLNTTTNTLEKVDSGSLNRFELNFRYDFK